MSANPFELETVAKELGLRSDQVENLKTQLAGGNLSAAQIQQLGARFSALNLSDAEVSAFGRSLGLSAEQIEQVKRTMALQRSPAVPLSNPASNVSLAAASADWQSPSVIETKFQQFDKRKAAATSEIPTTAELSQFGYSLFSSPVSTFAPVQNVPVGDDYVVGPGDELDVLIWGRVNATLRLVVDRDGTVQMDQIGPLEVAGLTFAQAKQLIESKATQITGVQANVTMGPLRTIQVFVIGEVSQPGAYTVSALSRVSNALVAAGGISKIGSLRNVELRHGNQLVEALDLYHLLLHGNTSADRRLEQDDVIFVPVIGSVVGVTGDVKRPAIYELSSKHPEDFEGVLKLCGGVTAFGYAERIQVERVENHQRMVALDLDLNQLASHHMQVHDGDVVRIFPVLPSSSNTVTLAGNVPRPGDYQWREGMRVSDLIREAQGVMPRTLFRYAQLKRQQGSTVRFMQVKFGTALARPHSEDDIMLQPRDVLQVYNNNETVSISGEVRSPGSYQFNPSMRLSDLISMAGGTKDDAYLERAELARTEVVNGARTHHSYMEVDLRDASASSDFNDPELKPNDEVFVRIAPGWHLPSVVNVKGQVLKPGPYVVRQGERLSSLLARCGGLLPDAYLPGAVFIRVSVKEMEQKRLDESKLRLQQEIAQIQLMPTYSAASAQNQSGGASQALGYLQQVLAQAQAQEATGRLVVHVRELDKFASSREDLMLEAGDEITVPRRPSAVSVLGQVYNPTAIVYDPALTLRDYLERAGGPSEGADPEHVYVVKADGSIITSAGWNGGRSRLFPLLAVVSGGFWAMRLEPGDTVYLPEKLIYVNNVEFAKDITQIIASTAESLGIVALLALR